MVFKKTIFTEFSGPVREIGNTAENIVELTAGVIPALLDLKRAGAILVLICDRLTYEANRQILILLRKQGIEFNATVGPELRDWVRYLSLHPVAAKAGGVVGTTAASRDHARDLNFTFVNFQNWPEAQPSLARGERTSRSVRKTNETEIEVRVDLDGDKTVCISTGLGYFDHMLEQLGKHGDFGLVVKARGDLHIDEHHTVEDTALAIGHNLKEALGDKRGIGRYGFTLPMDEAESRVSVDLSGRGLLKFAGDFKREAVGELSTEMVPHFFRSLAGAMGATLHVEVTGENAHHMVESVFKGVGRALRPALALGESTTVPSTKGSL